MTPTAIVLIGVIIIIALIAWMLMYKQRSNQDSLYNRLGGIYSIAAVINHFSDNVIENPLVGKNSPNPFLREWSTQQLDRLPGLKFMRTLWVADVSGGPCKFVPTKQGKCPLSLENAHKNLQISPAEFDAVAKELENSLDHFQVPAKEKQEVLEAFAGHKADVTTGFFTANNLAAPEFGCPFRP